MKYKINFWWAQIENNIWVPSPNGATCFVCSTAWSWSLHTISIPTPIKLEAVPPSPPYFCFWKDVFSHMVWRELAVFEKVKWPWPLERQDFWPGAAIDFEWLPRYCWSPLERHLAGPRKDEEGLLICSEIFISTEIECLEATAMKIKSEQSGQRWLTFYSGL